MINILHNTPVAIAYFVVMAKCLITITVLDVMAWDGNAHEQYREALESYREAVNRNTRVYKELVRMLGQTGQ